MSNEISVEPGEQRWGNSPPSCRMGTQSCLVSPTCFLLPFPQPGLLELMQEWGIEAVPGQLLVSPIFWARLCSSFDEESPSLILSLCLSSYKKGSGTAQLNDLGQVLTASALLPYVQNKGNNPIFTELLRVFLTSDGEMYIRHTEHLRQVLHKCDGLHDGHGGDHGLWWPLCSLSHTWQSCQYTCSSRCVGLHRSKVHVKGRVQGRTGKEIQPGRQSQ